MTGECATALFCLRCCGRRTVYCGSLANVRIRQRRSTIFAPEARRMKDDNSAKSIVFIVDDPRWCANPSPACFDRSACRRRFSALRRSFLARKAACASGLPGARRQIARRKCDWIFRPNWRVAIFGIPIIFMTGHGDIPMTVRAMKAGAVEFLTKPSREQDMLDAVKPALEAGSRPDRSRQGFPDCKVRFDTLTPREREIMGPWLPRD